MESKVPHLDGKRTGRPKGSKTKTRTLPSDIQWVLEHLSEDPNESKTKAKSNATQEMWKWAFNDTKAFMSMVMRVRLSSDTEKPPEEAAKDPCVSLVDDMLAGFEKSGSGRPAE
jgi:hypothetical protein